MRRYPLAYTVVCTELRLLCEFTSDSTISNAHGMFKILCTAVLVALTVKR